jgi:hypothetical protein
MHRITYLAAAGALVASSGVGAWAADAATGDSPAAHVRTAAAGHGADDTVRHHQRHGADHAARHQRHVEPGDDHGGLTRAPEPGDDNGGVDEIEPGDDNGGVNEAEPGDDGGGQSGDDSGSDDSSSEDGGHHGGQSGGDD